MNNPLSCSAELIFSLLLWIAFLLVAVLIIREVAHV